MPSLLSLILLLLLFAMLASADGPLGDPLGGLERAKPGDTRRESSFDPTGGNADCRWMDPGAKLVLADLKGPGKITHIWITINHPARFYSRQMVLRIWWDGEKHPSVECPIGDFFGIGNGMDVAFTSLPVKVSSDGRARNCYWPMPFAKSARIEVTNESTEPCRAFYYYVDWQKLDELPPDSYYFHAMYRQDFPPPMQQDYLIADIRGKGHYVGTVQSVYLMSGEWYGEGDDAFFIDGEEDARLKGTGTEDYFCDAWGFRVQDGPYYGTPVWEGYEAGDRGSAYRWHIADPVNFTKSLRVTIEHRGWYAHPSGEVSGHIERDDLMSSVAFWYQSEPHKPWPALPPTAERLPFTERALFEAESSFEAAQRSEGDLVVQQLGFCSAGAQLFFRGQAEGAFLELPFTLEEAFEGEPRLAVVHSYDYGKWQVLLDGEKVGVWDLYDPSTLVKDHKLGFRTLEAGSHTLRFECAGKNPESTGYFLGVDAVVARIPAYYRPPTKDLRDLGPRE